MHNQQAPAVLHAHGERAQEPYGRRILGRRSSGLPTFATKEGDDILIPQLSYPGDGHWSLR